jgi:hypothetical protein
VATPAKPAAPTSELGYAGPGMAGTYWAVPDPDETPELRWPLSVRVFDQMRRQDAQVKSVLRAVTHPVRRTGWRVDPNGARSEVVELVATDLGLPVVGEPLKAPIRSRERFSWADHLQHALLSLSFGHMFFEQVYTIGDDGRAHLRKLAPRMPRTIQHIDVAPDGGLVAIEQWGPAKNVRIPVSRLVAYVPEREAGNWAGESMLRAGYKNWLLKDRLLRVQVASIERNGMGVPLYIGAEGETDLSAGVALAKGWRSGDAAGAAVPYGANLVLRGVEGTLPDAEKAVRYHDEQIARAVLAHFLNLGTQTGSWALGSTFADFFTLSLQSVAAQIADVANAHVVEDLVDVNFGEDEPAPRIVFEEIGSRAPLTAEAINMLVTCGALVPDQPLEQHLRDTFGLPLKDPDAPDPGPRLPRLRRARPERRPERLRPERLTPGGHVKLPMARSSQPGYHVGPVLALKADAKPAEKDKPDAKPRPRPTSTCSTASAAISASPRPTS